MHHGQILEMPPVNKLHTMLQRRLMSLLSDALNPVTHAVDKEFPFRPVPEYEVSVADVTVFSLSLWEQTPDDDYFRGLPEIVIEVLSTSNSASEMIERGEICLRNGGQESWLVHPERESVRVIRESGNSSIYGPAGMVTSRVQTGSLSVQNILTRKNRSLKRCELLRLRKRT